MGELQVAVALPGRSGTQSRLKEGYRLEARDCSVLKVAQGSKVVVLHRAHAQLRAPADRKALVDSRGAGAERRRQKPAADLSGRRAVEALTVSIPLKKNALVQAAEVGKEDQRLKALARQQAGGYSCRACCKARP